MCSVKEAGRRTHDEFDFLLKPLLLNILQLFWLMKLGRRAGLSSKYICRSITKPKMLTDRNKLEQILGQPE